MTKEEYEREYNFHKECLDQIIERMNDAETFSALNFYSAEAMNILLKIRDCKYSYLAERIIK